MNLNSILNGNLYSLNDGILLNNNTIYNYTIPQCVKGVCCNNLLQTCSITNSSSCINGRFIVGQNCNSTICQLPIQLIKECTINYFNGTCAIYYSYNSTNSIPLLIDYGPNNFISPGSFNQGQPNTFNPGFNFASIIFNVNCNNTNIPNITRTLKTGE